MILDLCSGGDLAYHLSIKEIFEENEARFFIAEVLLAIEYIHSLNVVLTLHALLSTESTSVKDVTTRCLRNKKLKINS
jgi:serine/threonine protein kinase